MLGARVQRHGTQFGLWAPRATRVELALVGEDRRQQNHDLQRQDDGCWTAFVPGVGPEQRYGYRVHGAWAPHEGARFNPAKLLLDPYARAITSGVDYSGPIRDHTSASDYEADHRDSSGAVPLSVVVADSPPPAPLSRPVPLADTVLYELHVKGYTQLHPAVPGAPPRHLRRTGLSGGDRAPARARRHLGRAPAGPALRVRAVPHRPRAVQLLGLQHPRLLRPARRVLLGRDARPAGARVQGDGQRVPRRRDRGHPRRGLQPHRRGRARGSDAGVPRHRPRRLLPLDRQPAQRLRRHRLRQLRGHRGARRVADGAGFAALLGQRDGCRRVPLRPGHHLVPRRRAPRRPAAPPDPGGAAARPGVEPGQAHRRALGPRTARLPARGLRPTTGASGTTASATTYGTSGAATPKASPSSPYDWPGRPTSSIATSGPAPRASTSSPPTTVSHCATS